MQDLRLRLGRILFLSVAAFLIQSLSLSPVFAAYAEIRTKDVFTNSSVLKKIKNSLTPSVSKSNASFLQIGLPKTTNQKLFSSISSSRITKEVNLLSAEPRLINIVGAGIAAPLVTEPVQKLTEKISSNIFSKTTFVTPSITPSNFFSAPVITSVTSLPVTSFSATKKAKAETSPALITGKQNFPLFDKASLTFYCKTSAFFSPLDEDRCDYEKVAFAPY
jgi:hypothetical protein